MSTREGIAPTPYGPSWLALEPRIMFDGAGVATLTTVVADPSGDQPPSPDDATTTESAPSEAAPTGEPQFNADDQALFDALAANDAAKARQEVVFVSESVREYQKLLDGISPHVEVHVLDAECDGVEQMADVLAGRMGIDAIHLISHGSSGELHLRTGALNAGSMSERYGEELATIRDALSEQADILIYGCNFAEGQTGQQAVSTLAELTGADIQASTDLTGNTTLGGDWELEYQVGTVDTAHVSSDQWQGLLATITVTTTSDENNGNTTSIPNLQATPDGSGISLREAIIAANNTAGNDTISLAAGTYTLTSTGIIEDGSAMGDLDIQANITITGAGMTSPIINAGGTDRPIEIDGTGILTMSDVQLTGGSVASDGAGLFVEESGGAMTLTRVDITGNTITTTGRLGGGIPNNGTLIIDQSLIRNSNANQSGAFGGGISNSGIGTATITRSSIINNSADDSGGIEQDGTITIESSTIIGNTATGVGGGSLGQGGGLYSDGGTTTIIYSPIAGNTALGGDGGGAFMSGGSVNTLPCRRSTPITVPPLVGVISTARLPARVSTSLNTKVGSPEASERIS